MSTLASLRSSLRNRVHTIEVLLGTMTTPVQNLAQEIEHTGYIKRINEMTFEANGNLLDIEAEHGNDIEAPKLAAFKTSLASIEGRTSTANTNLCAWQASNIAVPIKASPSQNETTSDTGANQAEQAYRQKEAREKDKSK